MAEIKTIGLIGYGKLARHLAPALTACGLKINQWYVRNPNEHDEIKAKYNISSLTSISQLDESSDLILILVNDQSIAEVAQQLELEQTIVCHTSGMTPLDKLPQKNAGIFYPLNTFNGKQIDWDNETPIFLQAKNNLVLEALLPLASALSQQIYTIEPEDLQLVHLAAVISQNFSNHLIAQAEQLLISNNLDRQLIHPLLKTMVNNLSFTPASENQTGPAIRYDQITINNQQSQLAQNANLLSIYKSLSTSIQKSLNE